MLYNPRLDVFINVANAGSFTKAAKEEYITPAAVMKQINLLEKEIGVQLFERTHQGLRLTSAGHTLYHDAQKLIRETRSVEERVQNAARGRKEIIHIGTSVLNPASFLLEYWQKVYRELEDIDIQLVSFDTDSEHYGFFLKSFGSEIDLIAGIASEEFKSRSACGNLVLRRYPICCAVPYNHPLAERKRLSIDDLQHETLMLCEPGWIADVDALRQELTQNHPLVGIKDFPRFDLTYFNECANNGHLMISIEPWNGIYPLMKTIPVDWPYRIPYGLIFSQTPSEKVKRFVQAVQRYDTKR